MRRLLLLSVVMLFFAGTAFAACSGTAHIFLPAVVEGSGGILPASITLQPGSGTVYLSIKPAVGADTQRSTVSAITYAFKRAGAERENCDVLLKIGDENESYIEGPSAGVSIALLTYSALSGKQLRGDTIITGAIDENGIIHEVGGLYEKASALSSTGVRYFITPRQRIYEKILLNMAERRYNISIMEAETFDEIVDFMFFNRTISKKNITFTNETIPPDLADFFQPGIADFNDVAQAVISFEEDAVRFIGNSSDEEQIKQYFQHTINNQKIILQKGYVYSAANDAFLGYIEAMAIANLGTINLDYKRNQINACLSSIDMPPPNSGNYQWLIGAELRKSWAENKLLKEADTNVTLEEERYLFYRELMYADAWCHVSSALAEKAGRFNGKPINESVWEPLAKHEIDKTTLLIITEEEQLDHLDSARRLYQQGKYGAATFDAIFARTMQEVDNELANHSVAETIIDAENMESQNRTSLWGKVYQTQAVYLSRTGSRPSAYRIFRLAEALDSISTKMDAALAEQEEEQKKQIANITDASSDSKMDDMLDSYPILLFALVLLIALVVFYFIKNIKIRKLQEEKRFKFKKDK